MEHWPWPLSISLGAFQGLATAVAGQRGALQGLGCYSSQLSNMNADTCCLLLHQSSLFLLQPVLLMIAGPVGAGAFPVIGQRPSQQLLLHPHGVLQVLDVSVSNVGGLPVVG